MSARAQKFDERKRAFLKILFLSLVLPRGLKGEADDGSDFVSKIIGRRVSDGEIQSIFEVVKRMSALLFRSKAVKFLIPLASKTFRLWGWAVESAFFRALENFSEPRGRAVAIGIKSLFVFARYCTPEGWRDTGYTGPLRGRANFSRYPDPELRVDFLDSDIHTEVCIIGTGAGGSFVAKELAGKSEIVMLEAGNFVPPSNFTEREDDMIPKIYAGFEFDDAFSILLMRGRCVGGSTVHNTALFEFLPKKVMDYWIEKGLPTGVPLYEFQEKIVRELGITQIPAHQINANNRVCIEGFKRLGLSYRIPLHGRWGCIGAGFCELGCYWNRKFSTLLHILPKVQRERGVKIFARAFVEGIEVSGGKAKYVVVRSGGKKFRVYAQKFVLSAGAVGSALVVLKSFGKSFDTLCLHPSTFCAGFFDEEVEGWKGIPISAICDEFLEAEKGFVLMPYFAHPGTFSVSVGGWGKKHFSVMSKYKNIAVCSILLHDRGGGRVIDGIFSKFRYRMREDDLDELRRGILVSARVLFEAGARAVLLPFLSDTVICKSMREVERKVKEIYQGNIALLSVHPQATLPFGLAVDEEGKLLGLRNVWVADASVFPASCGVPPQLTVMALASSVASGIA